MSVVRYKQDQLPVLTEERKSELRKLAERPDDEIDFSDIPQLDDEAWKHAIRNPYVKPVKVQTSVRIDADIMAWLKSKGKGYQTRMNAILREAMLRSM